MEIRRIVHRTMIAGDSSARARHAVPSGAVFTNRVDKTPAGRRTLRKRIVDRAQDRENKNADRG